jgi:hypothetical protein
VLGLEVVRHIAEAVALVDQRVRIHVLEEHRGGAHQEVGRLVTRVEMLVPEAGLDVDAVAGDPVDPLAIDDAVAVAAHHQDHALGVAMIVGVGAGRIVVDLGREDVVVGAQRGRDDVGDEDAAVAGALKLDLLALDERRRRLAASGIGALALGLVALAIGELGTTVK